MRKEISDYFERTLNAEKIVGPKKDCEHYPCHFDGQDCTWCFCAFFPCGDQLTGGKRVIGRFSKQFVWSCEDCNWVHRGNIARRILDGIKITAPKPEEIENKHSELLDIRHKILRAV
ncbi:MAG: hypothetical protein HY929_00890 [Euryarchaeota archaeon]|nr:hypothetical protein [Euryarchaeota archaeon]